MPRDARLSDSCAPDRCCFSSLEITDEISSAEFLEKSLPFENCKFRYIAANYLFLNICHCLLCKSVPKRDTMQRFLGQNDFTLAELLFALII